MTLKVPIWVYLNRTLTVSLNVSIWVRFEGFGEPQRAQHARPQFFPTVQNSTILKGQALELWTVHLYLCSLHPLFMISSKSSP